MRIHQIKAFTQNPELGNPAMVIEGPVESERVLDAVKKARHSVSAVIDSSFEDDIPIRFFYKNGTIETSACGHATLAAAHIVLSENHEEQVRNFINNCGTKIEVMLAKDGRISQKQPFPELRETKLNPRELANLLKIPPDQILTDLPFQLAGSPGKMKLMIPITAEAIHNIKRDFRTIKTFCDQISLDNDKVTGLFPFARGIEGCDAHARHFPNRDEEDPVCGVGSLALAKYLQQHLLPNQDKFIIRCGPGTKGQGEVIVHTDQNKIFLEGYAVKETILAKTHPATVN